MERTRKALVEEHRKVQLNGIGGIGKTTIAEAYIYKYYNSYDHIVWINVKDNMIESFCSDKILCKKLEISIQDISQYDLFISILSSLKDIESSSCLLVLDNANRKDEENFKYLPAPPNWHVLLTSREHIFSFHSIKVDSLSNTEALNLFKESCQHISDDREISNLLNSIDYHTLGIELLAKTASSQKINLKELTYAIRDNVSTDAKVFHSEDGSVNKILDYLIKIFRIGNLESEERKILQQFTCLPLISIAYPVLSNLINFDNHNFTSLRETLRKLSQKGWLQESNKNEFRIHRLIVQVVLSEIPPSIGDISNLLDNIITNLEFNKLKDNPSIKFEWIGFARSILFVFKDNKYSKLIKLKNNLAIILHQYGDYNEAKVLWEQVLFYQKNELGKDHLNTAISLSNYALVIESLGEYDKAQLLMEKALVVIERYSETDIIITDYYAGLASIFHKKGELYQAKELFEKIIEIDNSKFGDNNPVTINHKSSFGRLLMELGQYEEALKLISTVLELYLRDNKEESIQVAHSRSNLGLVLGRMNKFKEAKSQLNKARITFEKILGESHPTTAMTYSNLSIYLTNLEEYDEAENLILRAIRLDEKHYGESHPSTINRYANYAFFLEKIGSYDEAEKYLRIVNKVDQKVYGEDHYNTAKGYLNLASVLIKKEEYNEYEEAMNLLKRGLKIWLKISPKDSQYIEKIKNKMIALEKLIKANE